MQTLKELTEIGMDLARDQARRAAEAAASGETPEGPDPGLAFSRVARAVRQSIALEARLSERLEAGIAAGKSDAEARFAQEMVGAQQRFRERLARLVEAAGQRERAERAEALDIERDERFEDDLEGPRTEDAAEEVSDVEAPGGSAFRLANEPQSGAPDGAPSPAGREGASGLFPGNSP